MGYDGSPLSRMSHVNLTTVSQEVAVEALRTVELAISRITGNQDPPQDLVVEPHLVVRSTTGPPPCDRWILTPALFPGWGLASMSSLHGRMECGLRSAIPDCGWRPTRRCFEFELINRVGFVDRVRDGPSGIIEICLWVRTGRVTHWDAQPNFGLLSEQLGVQPCWRPPHQSVPEAHDMQTASPRPLAESEQATSGSAPAG